jgi:hypothetical protein
VLWHTRAPSSEKPFRDELLSIERLEERALALAANDRAAARSPSCAPSRVAGSTMESTDQVQVCAIRDSAPSNSHALVRGPWSKSVGVRWADRSARISSTSSLYRFEVGRVRRSSPQFLDTFQSCRRHRHVNTHGEAFR